MKIRIHPAYSYLVILLSSDNFWKSRLVDIFRRSAKDLVKLI
jgi:hypothetical protein